MSKQRKFILISAAAGVISVFLPWATISVGMLGESMSQHANGFRNYGICAFLGMAVAAIVSLTGDQTKTLEKTPWIVSLIGGAISVLFIGFFMLNIANAFGAGAGFGMIDVGFGFGLWISLAASIAIIASAWLYKNPGDNLKGAFDSLKKDISVATTSVSNMNTGTNTNAGTNTSTNMGTNTNPSANTNMNFPGQNNTGGITNKIAELERLSKLRENGSITEEEYQQLKSKLL
jgi:hypothetical protein